MVATLVRTIFAQPDATQVKSPVQTASSTSSHGQFPATAEFLVDAEADLLAFSVVPLRALEADLVATTRRSV